MQTAPTTSTSYPEFTVDEVPESLDSAMAKKHKTLDSVVSSHTDGTQRSYNAIN